MYSSFAHRLLAVLIGWNVIVAGVVATGCAAVQRAPEVAQKMTGYLVKVTEWCGEHAGDAQELDTAVKLLTEGKPLEAVATLAALVKRLKAEGQEVPPEVTNALVAALAEAAPS